MFRITIDEYTLSISDEFPHIYSEYQKRADVIDIFDNGDQEEPLYYLSVAKGANWPFLIVAQRYSPGPEHGFYPGIILISETKLLFIGAGERLLAYTLDPVGKLWEEEIKVGFWSWARHQQVIIMSAEIELVAWDIYGKKQWSTFVEPPWSYTVDDDTIHLDVMGKEKAFSLLDGPGSLSR